MPIVFDIDNRKTPMNQLIDFIESMPETDYPKTVIMAKAMELVAEEKKQIQAAVNWGHLTLKEAIILIRVSFIKQGMANRLLKHILK